MLSLPLFPPSTLPTPFALPTRADSPPPSTQAQNPAQHRTQRLQRDVEKQALHARSPLALLAIDEASIAARKLAIRNFGAYWIRPPGVGKTLQAMNEEEVERREQEELERQERGMLDLQAQQTLAEAQARAAARDEEGEEGEEERDLDAEIPDADAEGSPEEETTGEVTFNEESMLEGSVVETEEMRQEAEYLGMEEAELTGAVVDEEELGILEERDLDDDVPDAGSYQHTDTELEDSSDESSMQNSFALQSVRRSARGQAAQVHTPVLQGSLQERLRGRLGEGGLTRSPGSLDLGSSVLEDGFGSSPVMGRGIVGNRGRVGGRWRGRGSRGSS